MPAETEIIEIQPAAGEPVDIIEIDDGTESEIEIIEIQFGVDGVDGASGEPVKLCSAIRGENISGARAVYLVVESGTVKCYLASSSSQEAHGFVREAGSSGAAVDVWEAAPLTALSGITAGQSYWLGASGQFVTAPPSGASVIQRLGRGVSTTEIFGRVHPSAAVL